MIKTKLNLIKKKLDIKSRLTFHFKYLIENIFTTITFIKY